MAAEIANIVGIIGVILLLIAFFFLQLGKLATHGYTYSFLNLAGALMILYSLFYAWNLPAVIIEVAWSLISIFGIAKRFFKGSVTLS
ncbi:MAG: hypothetical protein QM752_03570 [Gammaproteobacteria bacterium]